MKFRFIAISIAAAVAFAQPPGGPRMHMGAAGKTNAVQTYLNLTDAQVTSLKQLRQSEHAALKPIFDQMAPLHESLHTQMQASDAASVGKTMLSIQALEQQAAPIRASFQQQALAVLTPAQKTQLTALQNAAALMPAIHEAMELHLLTPPEGAEGAGGVATSMHMGPRFGGPR
jgi:Spy/CpxP family protein refolding chaperone